MRRRPATSAGPAATCSPGMNTPRGDVNFCCDFCKENSLKKVIYQGPQVLFSSFGNSRFYQVALIG